jgi:hypothetical protein
MKTPLCCSIFFFCFATMAQGQDLSSQPKVASQKIVAQSSGLNPISASLVFYGADETDKVCQYLRVYRVRRPYTNSDVTVPSGYTVCVPSWKMQVRSAVETQSAPVIGK